VGGILKEKKVIIWGRKCTRKGLLARNVVVPIPDIKCVKTMGNTRSIAIHAINSVM